MTADIFGKPVAISAFKGRKILLTFYRHIGCPVNNLRFQELRRYDTYFKERDLVVLAVYESSVENLTRYCRDESFYARLIANPEFNLYTQYEIEQSTLKMLYSMYKGVFAKSLEGMKHFKVQFEPEGDHMPTSEILKFAQTPKIEYQLS